MNHGWQLLGREADRSLKRPALLLLLLIVVPSHAYGSGFAIREQSTSAMGNAFAGATASALDLSYMFFNPAGLTRQRGNQVVLIANYLAPQSEVESASASTVVGTPIGGTSTLDDASENAVAPALYALWDIDPDFKAGLGVNAPFGLETDYPDGWVGRYHALNSRLLNVNINPVVAYRINDWLSAGAGLQLSYAQVRLTNAVDFGTIGFVQTGGLIGVPGQQDGHTEVESDDIGLGYNLGLLVEPIEGTRLGFAFRSKVSHEFAGDADFELDAAGTAAQLQNLAVLMGNPMPFVDTHAQASTQFPETASVGFHHDIDEKWSVMAEAAWTRWSRFKEIRIRFDNPGQPDNVTETNYHDTWFFALGATYRWNDRWTFRAGTAYDESPVRDRTRTPRIADEDRYWIALGLTYAPLPDLTLDVSYAHNFVADSTIDLTTSGVGNTFRGNLSASYDNAVELLSAQLTYRF